MPRRPKALVTGGTGALGGSVTRALAAAGFQVHVTSETDEDARRFKGLPGFRGVPVHTVELTDPAAVRRILKKVGGPLAAMVCCAGGYEGGPIAETPPEQIDTLIRMNLKSAIVALREAHPCLKRSPNGAAVVLIGARGALKGGPGSAVYAATKAAVANLALSLGEEWLDDGITVNAILPSTMDTPANRRAMPDVDPSIWPKTEQVAGVIAFLVSERARIISGGAIPVYGRA
jgi:NAD(P)-dependent dehydrogenase (short-subunit alcohol dehydrogenase family)